MNEIETRLSEDRENCHAARGLFRARLDQVKDTFSARSLGERVRRVAQDKAFDAIDQGIDIARGSKGVIALTAGSVLLWAFRAPLLRAFKQRWGKADEQEPADSTANDESEELQA